MSNKKENIYTSVYETYGKALEALINERKLVDKNYSQSALARDINTSPSQVNRWVNKGMTPVERTQKDIHSVFDAQITKTDEGWVVEPLDSISSDLDQLRSRKVDQDKIRTEKDKLVEYFQDRIIDLSKELYGLANRFDDLKNHSDD